MAMRRDLFEQLGGLRELGMRGIEDTEFGFRAHTAGALHILDRQAELWHQEGGTSTHVKPPPLGNDEPLLQDLIAAPGFRTSLASCPSVPTVMVDLRWADELAQIEPWLITSSNDVRFLVDGPQHADKRDLSQHLLITRPRCSPVFRSPAALHPVGRDTLDSLVEHLRSNMLGVLHVVDEDGEELLEVTATRAIGRAALAGVDRGRLARSSGERRRPLRRVVGTKRRRRHQSSRLERIWKSPCPLMMTLGSTSTGPLAKS